jgi:hypothetical protein
LWRLRQLSARPAAQHKDNFSAKVQRGDYGARMEVACGLGRSAALHHHPPASHQIHEHNRCLCF